MTLRETMWLLLIGILVSIGAYLTYRLVSSENKAKALSAEIYSLRHAPVEIDTVIDTIRIPGEVKIKPIAVREEIHDTVWIHEKISWYDSTFSNQGIRFRWRAKAIGELTELAFTDFVCPRETITITKQIDTCFQKPPEYRAKLLHWGLYTEAVARNITEFPGVGAGAQIVIRDQVTIGAGAMYQKEWYGNLRIGILFK